jgi:hypothetical protein
MSKGTIHLRDALRLLGERDPITGEMKEVSYVRYTHNRRTKRGGKRVRVTRAKLLTEDTRPNPRTMRARAEAKANRDDRRREVTHFKLGTRDFVLPDGSIDRAIICLITEVNGMRVML